MAETSKEQVSFGWSSSSSTDEVAGGAPTRSAERPPPSAGPAARIAEVSRAEASAGESQLPPDNELWDVRAAARFLKRSVSWVYHKAEDGTLPVRRLDGWGVRFIPAELRAWVERGASLGRRR